MTTSANILKDMISYQDVEGAIATLQTGGLILYPTDTVWSIGCDATDPVAIERICNLRGHRSTEDFEVLVSSLNMLREYAGFLHPKLETLLAYHVRPLTLLLNGPHILSTRLAGPRNAIAFRLVQDDFCRTLITEYDAPLIATSACLHNFPYPPNFGAVSSVIIEGVDYVIKFRQQEKQAGEPAVMVQLSERDELVFIRE